MSLYHPSFERDNCGFGLIAQMDGEASHRIVRTAIHGLDRMKHRGGIAADGRVHSLHIVERSKPVRRPETRRQNRCHRRLGPTGACMNSNPFQSESEHRAGHCTNLSKEGDHPWPVK